jgi:hypothetical protein
MTLAQALRIASFAALIYASTVSAATTVADAQSRCVPAADAWFNANYNAAEEHTKVGSGSATYTTHFSAARDACFMEVVAISHILKNSATGAFDSEIRRLVNLKTGQQIGQLVTLSTDKGPLACTVAEVQCSTTEAWKALAATYMRDRSEKQN